MTLEGFDGFRIKRADQSILFLGEGTPDGKVKPGGVVVLMHKEREVGDALEGMGGPVSDADLAQDVADLFKTNVHRAGLDVTKAELVPVKTWRRHEKEEMVGPWKSKVGLWDLCAKSGGKPDLCWPKSPFVLESHRT
jgi:hypothetical protein